MIDPSVRGEAALGIDIGGTFTDLVLMADGRLHVAKVLSTPEDYARGILDGLQRILNEADLPPERVGRVAHGTTVASNAVLEASGRPPALVTTQGFRDVIAIGRLRLPRLYDVGWTKPSPLVPRELRFEIRERVGADGSIVEPLDGTEAEALVDRVRASGVAAVAISLINAYADPRHEQALRQAFAVRAPELDVTLGSEVGGQIREVERTSTAVVNAYLRPVLETYLGKLRAKLDERGVRAPLFVSQSTGGLTTAEDARRRPVTIIESGPAAGVVAAAALAGRLGIPRMISFDMGGTTAKAASIEDGRFVRTADLTVGGNVISGSRLLTGAGHSLQAPAIDLAEVGAGGGSIVRVDAGGGIVVGPESAGSLPGPACYGLGGHLPTITDACVILGYLNPRAIARGLVPVSAERARDVFRRHVAAMWRSRSARRRCWRLSLVRSSTSASAGAQSFSCSSRRARHWPSRPIWPYQKPGARTPDAVASANPCPTSAF
jgi:N-methylhydantoinase A